MALSLMLALIFVVSMGYGVLLPVLPALLQSLARSHQPLSIAFHTGMLPGVYMGALFLMAPFWGRISDLKGRRIVLLTGLGGFTLSIVMFGISRHLILFYAAMAFAGGFAAAVLPVVTAWISEHTQMDRRARAVAWLSASSALGFFLGPAIGGWLATETGSPAAIPYFVVALFSGLLWIVAYVQLPNTQPLSSKLSATHSGNTKRLYHLLGLSWITMFSIGAFEVGVALQGQLLLKVGPRELGWLFAECSLVMIVVQLCVVAPLLKRFSWRAIWTGFFLMALGISLLPLANSYADLAVGVGVIAASAGLVIPGLAFFTSIYAGEAQGAMLGRQTAASSVGQAVGSGLAGGLFALLSANFLWLAAGLLLVAAFTAMKMKKNPGLSSWLPGAS
jgi:DHA1 family multidrug resistance protein-like MFS transporter